MGAGGRRLPESQIREKAPGRYRQAPALACDHAYRAKRTGLKMAHLDVVGIASQDELGQDREAEATLDHGHDGIVVKSSETHLWSETRPLEDGAHLVVPGLLEHEDDEGLRKTVCKSSYSK